MAENQIKEARQVKHVIWAVIWISAMLAGIFFLWSGAHETKTVTMQIESRVEQAVQMQSLENHFVQWRGMGFGGGGAGGQGTAVIWANSVQDFLRELKPGEKIYTVVQKQDDDARGLTVEKIYIAGIENRAMLLGYKDVYSMSARQDGGSIWYMSSYSPAEVVFSSNNTEFIGVVTFFIVLFGIIFSVAVHASMAQGQ